MTVDPVGRFLYFKSVQGNHLLRKPLDEPPGDVNVSTVIRGDADILAVSIDQRAKKLYWAQQGIHRANLDGTSPEQVVPAPVETIKATWVVYPEDIP